MTRAAARPGEAGFAMLFVFVLAAFVAIGLYNELPRVIFEGQRQREQMLIDRGEQYQRAIRVYYRRYRRYPPDLEALENTDNRRFLRRRYRDPMTGLDEWRLIHGLPNGVFTDSLVYKAPGQSAAASSGETASSEAETGQPLWAVRRPSDVTLPSSDELPMNTPGPASAEAVAETPAPPPAPTQAEAEARAAAAAAGAVNASTVLGGIVAAPTGVTDPGNPAAAGFQPQTVPGIPPGAVQPSGAAPGVPGAAPFPGSSSTAQAQTGANEALRLIQQLLTTPNPRGLAAVQITSAPAAAGPPGIAGVASKAEAEGIMVYNDRTKYNEWEFLYDPRTDVTTVIPGGVATPAGPAAPGGPGAPNQPGQRPGGAPPPTRRP